MKLKKLLHVTIHMMVLTTIMFLCSCATKKQEYKIPDPKTAAVSEDYAYHDKLQFPFDDKGLDLNVNIAFDETENILTLSISGSRQLMVFRKDVLYGMIFKHPFLKPRTLEPKNLPYPVLVQPNMKVTLSKDVWKSFRPSRQQHIFNNWLVGVSPELKTIEPSLRANETNEATLIVDSIVQRFRVDPKATKASFTLRNILVADKDGTPMSSIQKKRDTSASLNYQIAYDNDLNLTYNINIQRNPCFAQDSLIANAQARIKDVKKAYGNLREACPSGSVSSTQEQGVFNQHRKFLLSQYPKINEKSSCTALQEAYDAYNVYVDSIANAPCAYVKSISEIENNVDGKINLGVKAGAILDAAHRLDNIVAQIMVSRDATQKRDLIITGQNTINTITKAAREHGLTDDDQKKAYAVFLKAKNYFKAAILK